MSQIIIFGAPAASYVRTARIVCLEKGLDHHLEPVPAGSEANFKVHPWGKVPAMQHGELHLIECTAIARYFDELGSGPSLLPSTPATRAVMEQWISSINSYIYDAVIRNYALKYLLPRFRGTEVDPAQVAAGVPNMEREVARLETAYVGRQWIAGDRLSLADLFVAPIVQTLTMFPESQAALVKAPSLMRAYAALEKHESFVKVHAGLFGRPA
jgi:glutathione S-transferase